MHIYEFSYEYLFPEWVGFASDSQCSLLFELEGILSIHTLA